MIIWLLNQKKKKKAIASPIDLARKSLCAWEKLMGLSTADNPT